MFDLRYGGAQQISVNARVSNEVASDCRQGWRSASWPAAFVGGGEADGSVAVVSITDWTVLRLHWEWIFIKKSIIET